MAFIGIILLLINVFVTLSAGGNNGKPISDCSAVGEWFTDLFGDYSSSSLSTSSNPPKEPLSVCITSDESCCTPEMEGRFHVEAQEEIHYQLQESTSYLGFSLYVNDVQFKSDYTDMIERARFNMEDIFEEDYNRISGEVSSLLTLLFDEVKDFVFMEPGARDISAFVDDFYDKLFPLIYVEELHKGKMKGISESYAQCLTRNQKRIRPFGGTPKWTRESLENSLVPAKLLLQSIELGIKVINTTNNLKLTEACRNALTQMSYCQYCSGYVDLKPCNALCLNVMTGCFAGLYDIDHDWSRFLSSLLRLTSSMAIERDLERILRNIPKRMINGLSYLRNNKNEILDSTNKLCGEPIDVVQQFAVKTLQSLSGSRNTDDYSDLSMYVRINVFSINLRNSEAFLRSLPNQLCFLNKGASDFDSRCWTGKRFGNYQKFVWTGGVEQQSQNSEVRLTGREPELKQTEELGKDLQRMRKLILTTLSESGDTENGDTEISGSGSGSGCLGDDECELGSGSTSMTPTVETGAKFVRITKDATKIEATKLPITELKTDSDFSFDNTHSKTPNNKISMTTVSQTTKGTRNPTMRQTTERSNLEVTTETAKATEKLLTDKFTSTEYVTEKSESQTTESSTNKFIPTKLVTRRVEVDTQTGNNDGGTRLSVVWTFLLITAGLTFFL